MIVCGLIFFKDNTEAGLSVVTHVGAVAAARWRASAGTALNRIAERFFADVGLAHPST